MKKEGNNNNNKRGAGGGGGVTINGNQTCGIDGPIKVKHATNQHKSA